MHTLHKRIQFYIIFPIILILSLSIAALADSQTSKDVEIKLPSSTSQKESKHYFSFWFQINPPSQSKKDFNFRPPTSAPKTPDQLQTLRYLMLGEIDPDLALIIRLTDKAKERRIDPARFADYLASQQVPTWSQLSLTDRIHNLVLELCIYDLGQESRSDFFNYLQKIRVSTYRLSTEEDTFNYIIDLLENNIFTPIEAIDCLFLLKQEVYPGW
ncbi:MAG: hypothetical protein GX081_05095 [Firmicutes bacterium]|nr:hypothetical protein [Bacillota bacterium]